MKTKIKLTIAEKYRVLWSDDGGIRAGYKDFDTNEQATRYVTKLTTNENI